MFDRDYDEFAKLLDESYALISQGRTVLPPGSKALYFAAMRKYPIEVVRKAFTAHLTDSTAGKFCPVPAHLIAHIDNDSSDGHPGAEEAWAIAMRAEDEDETVIWTGAMQQAFGICHPVLETGDKVGARMAFKDAYNRLVAEARKNGKAATWTHSLGRDPARRELAIREAGERGRLPAPTVLAICPPQVEAGEVDHEGLKQVKEACAKLVPGSVRAAERRKAEHEAEQARKAEIAAQVAEYQKKVEFQQFAEEC